MSTNIVVKKYAKALFDVTYQKGSAGEVASQLSELSKIFTSEITTFFSSPFNSSENKITVAKSALEGKCTAETFNFVITLVQNERVYLMSEISKELSLLVQESAGITKGKLYSSQPVSADFIKLVEAKATQALGKKVELIFEQDETLIAGYKVDVAGWTMDDSAQAHLKILKDDLMKKGL